MQLVSPEVVGVVQRVAVVAEVVVLTVEHAEDEAVELLLRTPMAHAQRRLQTFPLQLTRLGDQSARTTLLKQRRPRLPRDGVLQPQKLPPLLLRL